MKHVMQFQPTEDLNTGRLVCPECDRVVSVRMGPYGPAEYTGVVEKGDQRAGHTYLHISTDPSAGFEGQLGTVCIRCK